MVEFECYKGHCHCGLLRVEFQTQWKPIQFRLRECDCTFCRRHGARTCRDPAGKLKFFGQPHWYRFGLNTADFLLCPNCGVYLAAVLRSSDGDFATLNVNCLEIGPKLVQEAKVSRYSAESSEERIARRKASWTPFEHHLT